MDIKDWDRMYIDESRIVGIMNVSLLQLLSHVQQLKGNFCLQNETIDVLYIG